MIRRHPLAAYLIGAFGWSWAWWIPLALRGDIAEAGVGWPSHLPGLLGPGLSALVVAAFTGGLGDFLDRCARFRVPWPWWLLVAGTFATMGLALLSPDTAWDELWRYSGVAAWPAAAVLVFVLLLNGYGEEAGWRGFLADRWLPRYGLTGTAVRVWLVWALWHLPLFWVVASFRAFTGPLVIGWLLGLLAGSVVLAWIYAGSGGSILLVAAWHTAFNFTSATTATSEVVAPVTSALVMVAAVVLLLRDRRG